MMDKVRYVALGGAAIAGIAIGWWLTPEGGRGNRPAEEGGEAASALASQEPVGKKRYHRRIEDLRAIAGALNSYRADRGNLPVSTGWDGLASDFGASSAEWIKGLAPKYIPSLPRDPRMDMNPVRQYLYRSDGKEFKLLSHTESDCAWQAADPGAIDPVRGCGVIAVWSAGARNW